MSGKNRGISLSTLEDIIKESPGKVHKIIVSNKALSKKILHIIELAKKKSINIQRLNHNTFEKKYPHSRGIYAYLQELNYRSEEELFSNIKNMRKIFVFDGIEDSRNLGAISRSLYFFGISAMVLPKKRSAPLGLSALRASAGALTKYEPYRVSSIEETLKKLKKLGFKIYGASEKAKKDLQEVKFENKTVIVFGQEGKGIASNVKNQIEIFLKIPGKNNINSLNLSVSASIFAFYISLG